jgi:hypothetical protein
VPTSFSATGVSADNDTGGAIVTFTAPDTEGGVRPVTSYQVENQNTGVITTVTSGSTVPLAKNTTQTFRVRAVNSAGTSAWSSSDSALSFRQSYGGENGYYNSSTQYVTIPAGVTFNYSLSSGAGSTSTPDTRVYGNVYAATLWYDNGMLPNGGPYYPNPVPYQSQSMGNYQWDGYNENGQYVYGYFSFAFGGYPYEEYWYGNSYNFGGTYFGVYTYQSTGQIGGYAPHGPDYGAQSIISNNGSQIRATSLGYNLTPNTVTGSYTSTGGGQTQISMGVAWWYYGDNLPYYGPSGRARIWYGT